MTSKEWKECTLEQISTILGDGLHGTPKYSINGKYAFINGNNLSNGKIVIKSDTKRVDKCEYEKYKKDLNNRTLLVSINGTLGNIAEYNEEKIILGKSACYFNVKEDIDKYFIKYILLSKTFQDYLNNQATGTTIKNISLKQMREYNFLLPSLETQQKIAKVLSAIDDKIELNNSINNNLEQQAQAIFKSWFVDFEPFGGTIPNDWKYVELGKLGLDISDGNYSSKYPKTNEFVSKGVAFIRGTDFIGTFISQNNMYYITEEKHNQLLKGHTKKDDILITTRGDIGRIAFVPNSLINKNINSQLVRINGANIFPKSYLACSLLSKDVQNDFKSLITGSALQQLPVGRLKKILLLKPNKDILNKFDYICKPLFNMSFVNYEENNRLVNLRDTLLPKLMSGEIDVSEVDISTDKLLFSEDK